MNPLTQFQKDTNSDSSHRTCAYRRRCGTGSRNAADWRDNRNIWCWHLRRDQYLREDGRLEGPDRHERSF